MDKRAFILSGTLVAGIAQFLIGPSQLFHLPNTKEMVLVGVITNGVGYSLGYNFLYAEAWRACHTCFPQERDEVIDQGAAIVNTVLGL